MTRRETLVQLSDELLEMLDDESRRRGVSRSALIRQLLQASLAKETEAEKERRYVEGYLRIPDSVPDEWGDLAAWGEAATADAYAEEPLE